MADPTSTKTIDLQPAALLEMNPQANSSKIRPMNTYYKENPGMTASKCFLLTLWS